MAVTSCAAGGLRPLAGFRRPQIAMVRGVVDYARCSEASQIPTKEASVATIGQGERLLWSPFHAPGMVSAFVPCILRLAARGCHRRASDSRVGNSEVRCRSFSYTRRCGLNA